MVEQFAMQLVLNGSHIMESNDFELLKLNSAGRAAGVSCCC